MHELRKVLEEARSKGVAIGHFNISDWVLLKAVFESAQELKVPVVVGASVFDLSALPFEKNIAQTKQAVEILKSINPAILVEGEIGDIGTGSEIHESAPDHAMDLTTPEEAKQYVDSTGVDILAPAVGNMHGMLQTMLQGNVRKRLNITRIVEIKSASKRFMTLHGGSGTDDDDLQKAIEAGINIIHFNTELRVAWRRGLEHALARLRLFNRQQSQAAAE